MNDTKTTTSSLASRYNELKVKRAPYEERAKECAKLTLPAAYPLTDDGADSSSSKIETPYQGIGSEGVTTLAAKLLLALMPPNTPCFRLRVPDMVQQKIMEQQQGQQALTLLEKTLARIEQAIQDDLEASRLRATMNEGFIQLLIAGNGLLYFPPKEAPTFYKLPSYVVRRAPNGEPLEMITHQKIDREQVPESVRVQLTRDDDTGQQTATEKVYDLFTTVIRQDGKWQTWQECQTIRVPGSDGTFPLDTCPFIPLRMYKTDGEDYGRSYTEQVLGDLKTLEGLTQAIVEGSAMASKVLFFNAPNGQTRSEDIEKAPNGAVITGRADDVTVLTVNKTTDFRTAESTIVRTEQRLSRAFMLMSSIQRDAERVTAEEIRALANELESTMGGVYSLLSDEYQRPLASLRIHQLGKANAIPKLPKGSIKLGIVAGLEALGRGHDRAKLEEFVKLSEPVPPEERARIMDYGNYLNRAATAVGLNPTGLIKDEETLQQEAAAAQQQQQQMQQEMQQQALTEQVMGKGMDIAGNVMSNASPEEMQQGFEMIQNGDMEIPPTF